MNIKHILLLVFISATALNINAQKVYVWLDAGIKGAYGPSMMVNSDILNSSNYSPEVNGSYSVGGKFGVNFGEYYAITFDGMYAQFRQKFNYKPDASSEELVNDYRWSSVDFYPLFRYNRTINYVEIGPRISWLREAEQANNSESFSDVTNDFNAINYSGVLGFGWYAAGDEAFTAIIGLRISYDLRDFVSDAGRSNSQVDLGLVEGSASTNPAFVQFVFELNWGLGYYAKSVCGGRSRFFSF